MITVKMILNVMPVNLYEITKAIVS